MNKSILLSAIALAFCISARAYEYDDDIYYNPKKQKQQNTPVKPIATQSSQLVDFYTMDVDEYNKRGNYFYTDIDTIGTFMENEPDFVYTTQIQKFYNPTIVTDNANVIQDILNNSYGNVEVIYSYTGLPSFVPWSYYNTPYWYYNSWYSPWGWNLSLCPFSIGWSSWWNWGPSWGWSWGWPGWGATLGPGFMANYRPGGRRPFSNMASNNFGGNFHGSLQSSGRGLSKGNIARRGTMQTPTLQHGNNIRPGYNHSANLNSAGRRQSAQIGNSGTVITSPSNGRPSTGITSRPAMNSTTRPAATSTVRPAVNSTSKPAVTSSPSNNSTNRSNMGGSRSGSSLGGSSHGGGFGGGGRSGGRR